MTQHFTKNTVSAELFCPKCNKNTQHRIDGGLRGPCLVCMAEPIPAKPVRKSKAKRPKEDRQKNLF